MRQKRISVVSVCLIITTIITTYLFGYYQRGTSDGSIIINEAISADKDSTSHTKALAKEKTG